MVKNTGLDELLNVFGGILQPRQMPPHLMDFIQEQGKNVAAFARAVKAKSRQIDDLTDKLCSTYQPEGRGSFLEVGEFEGYNSLQFFYSSGAFLDTAFAPSLLKLGMIPGMADRIPSGSGQETDVMDPIGGLPLLEKVIEQTLTLLMEGLIPFELVVKQAYQRAIDQYRYLQKRFCNIGVDDSRVYRNPWEREDRQGFDLNRVPYVKIELIKDNPLLTDMLLDIADNLPRQYTSKEKGKGKGKRKPKEVKHLDEFEAERGARVLVELSDPVFQEYVRAPRGFLAKLADSIKGYHEILSSLETPMKNILDSEKNNPGRVFDIIGRGFDRPIANPSSLVHRLQGINYMGVTPNEEDVKPSGQIERNYFAARKRLLEHLADAIDAIGKEESPQRKYELAKAAVEQGVKLKEKAARILETRKTSSLKKDKNDDNEFYVGVSGGYGEFSFEREPAPKVKLKDVYGKSFEEMKRHLEDLADYSKYLQLYGTTAPRGKIRSNLIAIGPYGCGKTEIGRAIAGDKRFIGADVAVTDALTCFFGEFEKNIDRIWDAAKELRLNSGDSKLVFLLMDEFDSWFSDSSGHWVDNTYAIAKKSIQMKLDGVVDYEGIITVGFTNEPDRIPLSIYRRFKYIDIVGELETGERIALLKHFLTAGLPLSRGFRSSHYDKWGEMLDGATGDVIGKVTDDIHYEFMRQFIGEHPKEAKKLNDYIMRATKKEDGPDKPYIKRAVGKYMKITPDWVEQKVQAKLSDPLIIEQVETAKKVYAEAHKILANLHKKKGAASGCIGFGQHPDYMQRKGIS